ncbi:hypothetical protein [Mesorhizobium sp. P5_C1]
MADEKDEPPSSPVELVVRRLADEAKITEDQAREPIAILGLNWASLVREARILSAQQG